MPKEIQQANTDVLEEVMHRKANWDWQPSISTSLKRKIMRFSSTMNINTPPKKKIITITINTLYLLLQQLTTIHLFITTPTSTCYRLNTRILFVKTCHWKQVTK